MSIKDVQVSYITFMHAGLITLLRMLYNAHICRYGKVKSMLKRSTNRTTPFEGLLYAHLRLFNIVVGCIHIKTFETSAANGPMLN